MQTTLKNIFTLVAVGITLMGSTAPIYAGRVNTASGVITGLSQSIYWASGSMVGARYGAGTSQFIGCNTYASTDPNGDSVWCQATDSTNHYLNCTSKDPKFQEVIQGITDSSHIYFATASNGGLCSHIEVYQGSDLLK